MLKKFPDAKSYIDNSKIVVIDWFKKGTLEKYPYAVSVFTGNHWHVIKSFETEEQAESYADKLAAELNGNGGVIFTKDYLEKNTDKFVIDGEEYYYCDVTAIFEKDDEVFVGLISNLKKIYSARNSTAAKQFIEDFAANCPHLKQIKGTHIFFNEEDANCVCIGAGNTVYAVVGDVMIEVGECENFEAAESYCNKLRDEYYF